MGGAVDCNATGCITAPDRRASRIGDASTDVRDVARRQIVIH